MLPSTKPPKPRLYQPMQATNNFQTTPNNPKNTLFMPLFDTIRQPAD